MHVKSINGVNLLLMARPSWPSHSLNSEKYLLLNSSSTLQQRNHDKCSSKVSMSIVDVGIKLIVVEVITKKVQVPQRLRCQLPYS